MEKILNNPGLVDLVENIFGNLDDEKLKICEQINQSSKQILANPNFWLRKFTALSNKNQTDWLKAIQSVKNTDKANAIRSYLQWILKKEEGILMDLPCYSSPAVQDDFRKRLREICKWENFFDESMKIVTLLAPLTDNISDPVVQVYFRKRIWGTCKKWQKSSDKDIEIDREPKCSKYIWPDSCLSGSM